MVDYGWSHHRTNAFVFVAPEYIHGISGALKNAIDFLYVEWTDKATGFIGYGYTLGARAVEHLRGVMASVLVATVRPQVGLSLFTDFENSTPVQTRGDAGKESQHHAGPRDRMERRVTNPERQVEERNDDQGPRCVDVREQCAGAERLPERDVRNHSLRNRSRVGRSPRAVAGPNREGPRHADRSVHRRREVWHQLANATVDPGRPARGRADRSHVHERFRGSRLQRRGKEDRA